MAGKIFVNYRRDDVPGDARGVCQSLATEFGKSNVFMDVDNLLADSVSIRSWPRHSTSATCSSR